MTAKLWQRKQRNTAMEDGSGGGNAVLNTSAAPLRGCMCRVVVGEAGLGGGVHLLGRSEQRRGNGT